MDQADRRITAATPDERHLATATLREHEARFRLIAETMSDLIVQADADGVVTYVSPAIRRYGYEPEQLIGLRSDALVHPDDKDRAAAYRQLAGADPVADATGDTAIRCRTAAGGWVWLEGRPQAVLNDEGRVIGSVSVLRDVTARRAQSQLFETAFRYAPVGMSLVALDGRFLRVNDALCAMLGYAEAQLLAMGTPSVSHPDDMYAGQALRRSLLRGEIANYQHDKRYVKPDGAIVWLRLTVALARNADGSPDHFITQYEDLTERLVAEAALRDSEMRYRLIADNSSDLITMTAADGRHTYISPSIRNLGYEPDEARDIGLAQLLHPDDLAAVRASYQRHAEGAASERLRLRMRHGKTGAWRWMETAPVQVRDPVSGELKGVLDCARDVTVQVEHEAAVAKARAEAEEAAAALNASEARYRMIAENTSDLIAVSDTVGRLTYLSPSLRLLGYEPEDLIGRTIARHVHPDDREPVWASLQAQLAGAPRTRLRWRLRHGRSGDWIWLESEPSRLFDPATGEGVGFLDVVRDVSPQVRQEETLAQARIEAEAAAVAKSRFLANMSHEIRTPLTAVLGFTRLLQRESRLDAKAEDYVARIAGAGSALLAIVNDILDFSKIEAGMITLRPQPTEVESLARESLALFAAQASDKGITLALETARELAPSVMIDGDRLRQVLINLIGNAVKFTGSGGVTLRIAPADRDRTLRFEVEDTGPGLDADQCAELFQRFNQVDGSTMRQHGGTGLGLAISKGLVEAMGGGIGISSLPGQGSIFYFELPAEPVAAPSAAEEEEPASVGGLRVMVVDDNQTNRELARLILEALGAEVVDAESGASALAQLASLAVDVVLMDLRMPGMDGHQALSRLAASRVRTAIRRSWPSRLMPRSARGLASMRSTGWPASPSRWPRCRA